MGRFRLHILSCGLRPREKPGSLYDTYQKWCSRKKYNFSEQKAVKIYNAAKEMVVLTPKTALTKLLVQQAAEQLTTISRSVEIYRAEMNRLASQLPEYPVVMDMYAVGDSTGPQLMAEIGDIRRFAGKQSLVAFAGVDPLPNESGDKYSRSIRITKHGSPYLRRTLFSLELFLSIYQHCSAEAK